MVAMKAALILFCTAAVLSQASGHADAKNFAFFDKFAGLAHFKKPTTTRPPLTVIYLPAYPPLTNPTLIDTPTSTLDNNLGPLPDTPTTPTATNNPPDTDTPITTVTNSTGASPASPALPATTTPVDDGTGVRSYDSLEAYLADEDDEAIQDALLNLEESNSNDGRATAAQRQWLKRQQMQLRKQQSHKNKLRQQQQQQRPTRRPQNSQNNRIAQANRQIRRLRNEVRRLRDIVRQLRQQLQNANRRPTKVRIRYPEQASPARHTGNEE